MRKSLISRFMYTARDYRSRPLFAALTKHCQGRVLDVGGWDFYLSVQRRNIPHDKWTCVEIDPSRSLQIDDPRFELINADGLTLPFADESFDVVLNIQVLEHVFDPHAMVLEMVRVLRPGGHLIVLAPQTSNIHLAPHHYGNLTAYWLRESCRRSNLEISELQPLGGAWSTLASRLLYFIFQAFRMPTTTYKTPRDNSFFLLLPFALVTAVICIPWFMILSLADMEEEPNNHLLVARKPSPGESPSPSQPVGLNPLVPRGT